MRAIDGTKLKEFTSCPRLPFLALNEPREIELPPTERMRVLFASGGRVEKRLLAALDPEWVAFRHGDFDGGFSATLEAMERRHAAIANGVLKLGEFLGRPDLLLLDPGSGRYEVADVKSTARIHASAVLQVAFYSRMLGQVRPAPERGHVILRDGERVSFRIADYAATVERALEHLQAFRAGRADPGPHRIEACRDCRYRERCGADLEASDDVAQVPGLTRAQRAALAAAGCATVAALAGASDAAGLAQAAGLTPELVQRLRARARALRQGAPVAVGRPRPELAAAKIALAALVDHRQRDFGVAVAGVLRDEPQKFKVRLLRARECEDPAANLRELVGNLDRSSGPIAVFGGDVGEVLDAGSEKDPSLAVAVDRIRHRFVDLRAELRRTAALPGFDRTLVHAAEAAGILPGGDAAEDLDALRWLEEEPGADALAVERRLRRDAIALVELCRFVLAWGARA